MVQPGVTPDLVSLGGFGRHGENLSVVSIVVMQYYYAN